MWADHIAPQVTLAALQLYDNILMYVPALAVTLSFPRPQLTGTNTTHKSGRNNASAKQRLRAAVLITYCFEPNAACSAPLLHAEVALKDVSTTAAAPTNTHSSLCGCFQ